jgi:hypothetical protein
MRSRSIIKKLGGKASPAITVRTSSGMPFAFTNSEITLGTVDKRGRVSSPIKKQLNWFCSSIIGHKVLELVLLKIIFAVIVRVKPR